MIYNTPDHIIAFTTPRQNGYSQSVYASNNLSYTVKDDVHHVNQNREKLARELGYDLSQWVFVAQCHSDKLTKVSKQDGGKGAYSFESGIPLSDAIYTFDEDLVLSFFHADCVPVLMYDETTNLIVAIHAGWKGTLNQITKKSIQQLINDEQINPSNLNVIIGPCLSFDSCDMDPHEVQQELDFNENIVLKDNRLKLNTQQMNIDQCLEMGIPKENIRVLNEDTYSNPTDYYSFQRDNLTGRHLSGIVHRQTKES